MNRYLILIEFTPNNLQLQMFDKEWPAIYPSIATAQQGAKGAIWQSLRWWIVSVDRGVIIKQEDIL